MWPGLEWLATGSSEGSGHISVELMEDLVYRLLQVQAPKAGRSISGCFSLGVHRNRTELKLLQDCCFSEVLLLSWNECFTFDRGYQFLEIFSGKGNVSKKWWLGRMLA